MDFLPKYIYIYIYAHNLFHTSCCCWSLFYSAVLPPEQIHCSLVVCDSEWVTVGFYGAVLNIHQSGALTALSGSYTAGATWCCSLHGTRSVYAIQSRTSLQCHFTPRHIGKSMHANWRTFRHTEEGSVYTWLHPTNQKGWIKFSELHSLSAADGCGTDSTKGDRILCQKQCHCP